MLTKNIIPSADYFTFKESKIRNYYLVQFFKPVSNVSPYNTIYNGYNCQLHCKFWFIMHAVFASQISNLNGKLPSGVYLFQFYTKIL